MGKDNRDHDVKEWLFDRVTFLNWQTSENGDNSQDLKNMKKAIRVILREYVTEQQKIYITEMFVNKLSGVEIADKYGVAPSTVTRTIHRGLKNIYSHLRFVSPALIEVPMKKLFLSKRVYR